MAPAAAPRGPTPSPAAALTPIPQSMFRNGWCAAIRGEGVSQWGEPSASLRTHAGRFQPRALGALTELVQRGEYRLTPLLPSQVQYQDLAFGHLLDCVASAFAS